MIRKCRILCGGVSAAGKIAIFICSYFGQAQQMLKKEFRHAPISMSFQTMGVFRRAGMILLSNH